MKYMNDNKRYCHWGRWACMALLAMVCSSCNKDTDEFIPQGGNTGNGGTSGEAEAQLQVIASKKGSLLNTSTWQDYNTLGLFVTSGTLDKPYLGDKNTYSNIKATMNAGIWQLNPANVKLTDEKAFVYAYSPYYRGANPYEVPVETATRTLYMYGTHLKPQVSVSKSNPVATIEMQHAMAVIDIYVRKTAKFKGEAVLNEVTISGRTDSIRMPVKGTLDIMTGYIRSTGYGTYGFDNLKQTLTDEYNDACMYRLTAIPRDNKQDEVKLTISINGSRMHMLLSEDQDWVAGVHNVYKLLFDGADLVVEDVRITPYKDVEIKDAILDERDGK